MTVDAVVMPGHPTGLQSPHCHSPSLSSSTSAILAIVAVPQLRTPACEGNSYNADVRRLRYPTLIRDTVVGMALPIRGIHAGQVRIANHQEILAALRLSGDRPVIGARDHDCPIEAHDLI